MDRESGGRRQGLVVSAPSLVNPETRVHLEDFIAQIEELKRQRDEAVTMLNQIRELLESILAEDGQAGS